MQDRTEGDCEEVPSEASVDPTGAREPAGPSGDVRAKGAHVPRPILRTAVPRVGGVTLAAASLRAGMIFPGTRELLPPPPQGNKSHPQAAPAPLPG